MNNIKTVLFPVSIEQVKEGTKVTIWI